MVKRILHYLNPIARLGKKEYSIIVPLLTNIFLIILSEFFTYQVAKNSLAVGGYIIFINVSLVIYFAFHDGIRGGIISTIGAVLYYLYIIYTRHYKGNTFVAGIETTVMLGLLYAIVATVIGGLKEIVDGLIERESNARRRLETIIEQLPVGVVITNRHGVVEKTNKQLEKILGQKIPVGLVAGKDLLVVSKRANRQISPSQTPLSQTLKTQKTIIDREMEIESSQRKNVTINVSASVVRNAQGQVIAGVSIVSDITAQKELEMRKDDFISLASHELKTPLTSVMMFTEVLKRRIAKHTDKKVLQVLKKMEENVNKLNELVKNILDVSKISKGKMKVSQEKFLVKELVDDIIEDLRPITNHQLIVDWHTRDVVRADKERIRQVLINLITNAVKYSPKADKVIISCFKRGKNIEVSVRDFGIGIPKIEQKKVFNRFYQVSNHATYPGLGLGLYISHEIIKANNGKMWVESEEGKGSTFYFSLPIYKETS
jgi:PAS domain S-box-containing protein